MRNAAEREQVINAILKSDLLDMKEWTRKEINNCPYWITQKLLEWHFDIFGLINKGLAIKR